MKRARWRPKSRPLRAEVDSAHHDFTTSLERELADWKVRIGDAAESVGEEKAEAKTAFEAKVAELHAKHDVALAKTQELKRAHSCRIQ